MQDDDTKNLSGANQSTAVIDDLREDKTPPLKTEAEQTQTAPDDDSPDDKAKEDESEVRGKQEAELLEIAKKTSVGIVQDVRGFGNTSTNTINNYLSFRESIARDLRDSRKPGGNDSRDPGGIDSRDPSGNTVTTTINIDSNGKEQSLDGFVTITDLQSPCRAYRSIAASDLAGYSGLLQTERILLLTCRDEIIAQNVAECIAQVFKTASKKLVTIDRGQGRYSFRNLIDALSPPKVKRGLSSQVPTAICVWDADGIDDDEIASDILTTLLSRNTKVKQYKDWLVERGLCLICLVSPERVREYNHSSSGLRSWQIDFLTPLLEQYEQEHYETLADTIKEQRRQGKWSEDGVEFYREIRKHLRAGNLTEIVAQRTTSEVPDIIRVEDIFNRQDPITDTVLYCATYFPDLSPQDFSFMVELFLGDTTEEVTRRVNRREQSGENGVIEIVESVPLVNRWRREADAIVRRCKLSAISSEDNKVIIDFQIDGFRHRLGQHIRDDHPFLHEWNFTFVRQQGLLFSSRKLVADGARQLLVQAARQYSPKDVANWLYEVIFEFEKLASTTDRLKDAPLFHLLPDISVRAARRYISYGLSRILTRLDKEDDLREAVRLFWQKLLQNKHQWFIYVLRRMGESAPPESLKWLRQLLDQHPNSDVIRVQACVYLVGYLIHVDSSVYPMLKELLDWPKSTPAGRSAQQVLLVYCAETNREVAQQDYGKWPSLHPLFAFQNRSEAEECLDALVRWVCTAAKDVDSDKAVADIVAGWYFVLSPSTSDDSPRVDDESDAQTDLSAAIVRELLFKYLMRHTTRKQRTALPAIWDHLRKEILDTIFNLDSLINEVSNSSLNPEPIADATTARCKLQETRTSLGELRKTFIAWAAKTTPAKD